MTAIMTSTSNTLPFGWILNEPKIRDGRYGSVFLGLRSDTGELLSAEQLDFESPTYQAILNTLKSKPQNHYQNSPNIVTYLGYQQKGPHTYILTEHCPGDTLQKLVKDYGITPPSLLRSILKQILSGLEELQQQGFAVVFLDPKNILLDNLCRVKIEAPILDIMSTGQGLSSTILTVPEIILGGGRLRKLDIWMVGIIAAQMISGDCGLGVGVDGDIVTKIKEEKESAWSILVPKDVASKLDESAADFLRRCFMINIDQRPSISELQNHPFLSETP